VVVVIYKMQVLHQNINADVSLLSSQSAAFHGFMLEKRNGFLFQIRNS
jgi:hypothetical protein